VNTPQFGWVKSRLPRRAQPVPPIYQPEVVAEAVLWAAEHDRRGVPVGFSTVVAIWGNRLAPDLADRYLARTAYESQQTDEPEDPRRPNNLWEPVPGDHGAHGRFDARARSFSVQFWLSRRRRGIAVAAAAIVGLALGLLAEDRGPRRRVAGMSLVRRVGGGVRAGRGS
jgi:hypothetical protein